MNTSSKEEFTEKARKVHGDKYDYSKVEYINNKTKVCIICPKHGEFWQTPNHHKNKYTYDKSKYDTMKKNVVITCPIHGDFEQTPDNHLHGKGCPKCNESSLEKFTRQILETKKIIYEYQKHFKWLGKQSFDFFIHTFNIAIECQGIQHYEPVDFANKGKEWAEMLYEKNKNDFINELNKWAK